MNAEMLEEVNATVYHTYSNELEKCFDKALCQDGGESWVLAEKAIEALTEQGFMIVKVELT